MQTLQIWAAVWRLDQRASITTESSSKPDWLLLYLHKCDLEEGKGCVCQRTE